MGFKVREIRQHNRMAWLGFVRSLDVADLPSCDPKKKAICGRPSPSHAGTKKDVDRLKGWRWGCQGGEGEEKTKVGSLTMKWVGSVQASMTENLLVLVSFLLL